jgi:hypothetical protein
MLEGQFRKVSLNNGRETFMPFVRATLIIGERNSPECDGLIDTGASINLISMSSAAALLGKTAEEVKRGEPLNIRGVGSANSVAYGWQVDLHLRATTASAVRMIWQRAWVFVTEKPLPLSQILLGQFTGLEEKLFVHSNRAKRRYWMVKELPA